MLKVLHRVNHSERNQGQNRGPESKIREEGLWLCFGKQGCLKGGGGDYGAEDNLEDNCDQQIKVTGW